jgi:hypothetical protein
MTKPNNKGNIRLKRVIEFTGSTRLGITLPRAFIRALKLRPRMFVQCELKNNDKSVIVEKINID